jgi:GxxExxY protein
MAQETVCHRGREASQSLEGGDPLTQRIIACAIEVHRNLGPGLLESTYEEAMCIELGSAGLQLRRQASFPILYKGKLLGEYRIDLLIEDQVIVEIKSAEHLDPVSAAQVLTYLRAIGKKVGLLITFNSHLPTLGVKRFLL